MNIKILSLGIVVMGVTIFLLSLVIQPAQAAFLGSNGKIAFGINTGVDTGLYVMNADGTVQTRLTTSPADSRPNWSPDGKKIAFTSSRDGNFEIYSMNADGSGQTRLTNNTASDADPAWSPDGTKIIFRSDRTGNQEIFVMNADGTSLVNLSNNITTDRDPNWSPDGSKIAFTSSRDGNNEIYSMNADGTSQVRLTTNSLVDTDPNWSPDGSKIAFRSTRDGNSEIYKMNADGSVQERLTNITAEDNNPAWSPDGSKIAFTSRRDGNGQVYVMNTDGSFQLKITNNLPDTIVDWQPLIGTTTQDGNGRITTTISVNESYPILDYTVDSNQTLILDGELCDITVESGGILMGTGTACTITVEPTGTVSPGHSPGCLSSGDLSLAGNYQAELAGTTACSEYDQMQVTGTVTVGGTLTTSLLNGFVPAAGNVFTIIANDATDPVTGTFVGLPEGATFTIGSTQFRISYVGGDGNDVTLTVQAAAVLPGLPKTGSLTTGLATPVLLKITGGVLTISSVWVAIKYYKKEIN